MADTTTSILDWKTTATDNTPANSSNVNSSASGEYNGLANAIRDVKGVIRAESLNLGWDPSASISNKGTRFISMSAGSPTKITIKPWYGKWMRGVEGQQFVLAIRTNDTTANADAAPVYSYYTGYVASTQTLYSSSNPAGSDVYVTGLRKWATENPGQDSGGLTVTAVDAISGTDIGLIGSDSSSSGTTEEVYLDFSAYPPMQNLGYASDTFRKPNVAAKSTISKNNNPNYIEQSPVPRRSQCGKIRISGGQTACAVFPYPEVDTNYALTVTPTWVGTGTDTPAVGAFLVESVKKSKSFVSITFAASAGSSSYYIEYDWEITRNY